LRASVRRHRRAQGGSPMLRSIRPTRATPPLASRGPVRRRGGGGGVRAPGVGRGPHRMGGSACKKIPPPLPPPARKKPPPPIDQIEPPSIVSEPIAPTSRAPPLPPLTPPPGRIT